LFGVFDIGLNRFCNYKNKFYDAFLSTLMLASIDFEYIDLV